MDGFLKKVVAGGGATLLSLLVVKVMAIVNSVIAARLLEPADYGALSIIVNLQNLVVIVACFGIPLAITKHVAQWSKAEGSFASAVGSALLTMLIVSSVVTAIGYLLLSPIIADVVYSDPRLIDALRLSAAFVLTASINFGMSSVLQGSQRIATLAKINGLVAVLAQPVTYLAILAWGLSGAVIAMAIANAVSLTLIAISLRGVISLSFGRAKTVFRKRHAIRPLISFTIPSFLASLIVVPAYWIGRTELALNWDLSSVGQFQIAESLSQLVLIVPTAVSVPLLPLISEQSDLKEVSRASGSLLKLAVFFGIPFSLAILPFLRSVITILYGSAYDPANDAAVLMFSSSTFIALGTVISSTIIGVGRMWLALSLNAFWLACFLTSVFILIPSNGTEGLAGAYAVSYLAYLFALIWYFHAKFEVAALRLVPVIVAYVPAVAVYLLSVSSMSFLLRLAYGAGLAAVFLTIGYAFVLGAEERGYIRRLIRWSR